MEGKTMNEPEIEGLWNVEQLAAFLNMSARWIRGRLTLRTDEPGSIPTIRFGRTPRFNPEEIRGWLQAGCPPAADWASWQNGRRRRA